MLDKNFQLQNFNNKKIMFADIPNLFLGVVRNALELKKSIYLLGKFVSLLKKLCFSEISSRKFMIFIINQWFLNGFIKTKTKKKQWKMISPTYSFIDSKKACTLEKIYKPQNSNSKFLYILVFWKGKTLHFPLPENKDFLTALIHSFNSFNKVRGVPK